MAARLRTEMVDSCTPPAGGPAGWPPRVRLPADRPPPPASSAIAILFYLRADWLIGVLMVVFGDVRSDEQRRKVVCR